MARIRKKPKSSLSSTEQCKFCLKYFKNIQSHYYRNTICAEFNMNFNLSLVGHVNAIQQSSETLELLNVDRNTYSFFHTNDMDNAYFQQQCTEINNNSTDIELEFDSNESNKRSVIDNCDNNLVGTVTGKTSNYVLSHNDSYEDESVCSNRSLNDNFRLQSNEIIDNDYHSTCQQIDSLITLLTESKYSTATMKPPANGTTTTSTQQSNIVNNIHDDFTEFNISVLKQKQYLPVDKAMICSIKLLKMMKDSNIASCNYSKLITWHLDTLLMNTEVEMKSYIQMIKSKKTVIEYLHNILFQLTSKQYSHKPMHQILLLPSHRNTRISKFDLKSSLVALLTDPEIMKNTNLLLDDPTYIDPTNNNSTHYCDIHHGTAFQDAHKQFCKNKHDILIPVIPFIDGTPIDPYGRNKLEVFMYTLGLFKQNTRNKVKAWKIANYSRSM